MYDQYKRAKEVFEEVLLLDINLHGSEVHLNMISFFNKIKKLFQKFKNTGKYENTIRRKF